MESAEETDGSGEGSGRTARTALSGRLLALLDELCAAHGPPGREDEVDAVVTGRLEELAGRVWRDAAGNVIAHIAGREGVSEGGPLLLNAHKDEIALMVKRIEPDGRMHVRAIGGAHAWKWGEGPVDLLADDGTAVPAILGFGATHVSAESPLFRVKDGRLALTWDLVSVDAKLSRTELAARGVHAGTQVVLERSRKRPRTVGDFVCAHALDDRGGVAVLLEVARALRETPPARDVYLVFSSMEEIGGGSVLHAAHVLGAGAMVGVEIVPAVAEYGVTNDARPVLVHADATSVYDPGLTRRLAGIAGGLDIEVQHAVLSGFGSDPGAARRGGGVPMAALLGFATENTHGYEVAHMGGLTGCVALIEGLVRAW